MAFILVEKGYPPISVMSGSFLLGSPRLREASTQSPCTVEENKVCPPIKIVLSKLWDRKTKGASFLV